MVDYDIANARLTSLATFIGGLSFIGLILSVNIMTGKGDRGPRRCSSPSP